VETVIPSRPGPHTHIQHHGDDNIKKKERKKEQGKTKTQWAEKCARPSKKNGHTQQHDEDNVMVTIIS